MMNPALREASRFRNPEQFRDDGRLVVEWVANYLASAGSVAVQPDVAPGDTLARLPRSWPTEPGSIAELLGELDRDIMPGMTHWGDPSFFGYFPCTNSSAGMLADLLVSATNVSTMKWSTSPAATELEQRVLRWLGDAIGLDDSWSGVITEGGSISTIIALAAARDRATSGEARRRGISGTTLRMYTSDQVHSSVDKAIITLGIGESNLVKLATDGAFSMRPEALRVAIAADRAAGLAPAAVIATIGTTSTTSVDPIAAIATICREEGLWLHVDAAYGGNAALLPELRAHFVGMELADSVVLDPHKWLMTPLELSCLYFRDHNEVRQSLSVTPAYLASHGEDAPTDFMDYSLQLGRSFRALKLWVVMRHHGRAALEATIRHSCALAREFAGWVGEAADWEIPLAPPFATLCFRYAPPSLELAAANEVNLGIQDAINRSGLAFVSRTILRGRLYLRVAIGHPDTSSDDLARLWAEIQRLVLAPRPQ
ncbi:MAG: pyridoxal-dependent decarboxylase [Gemmatimonadota bacterium]